MSVVISNTPSKHHYYPNNSIFNPTSMSPISKKSFATAVAALDVSPAVTKRKRPARLDIPVMPVEFGVAEARIGEVVEEVSVVEEVRDGFYSVCCKKGTRRSVLEDRFSVDVSVLGDSKQAIFGVFDGHGGAKAAEYAAENLNKNIMAEVVNRNEEDDIKEAVKHGYLKTDLDFLETEFHGGSCCVVTLITKGNLVVSNAGDCRAVMSRAGLAEVLTSDHRPSRQDEKDRIEAKGGYIDCYNGVWRIQGSLAVSRAIGDKQLKQWVIAEPETRVVKMSCNDEFLILASDGLWDKVTNQEAVDIVHPLFIDNNRPPILTACKRLVDMAVSRGSLDDVSVMIVPLQQYTMP
ncbi:putative protein phosphatase 2C 53 [Silene latifolia]|uniref:putative protein phosphatase 2C 53 n=1 Tax=Silene latifolia TaxID=37657 RepID=UPI003D7872D3